MASVIADLEACIPALRRFATALLRDPSEADVLVHKSLSRALDRLPAGRLDDDPRAWLFGILHGLVVSRAGRVKPPALAEPGLLKALDELPIDQRSVLLLVAVEEFSYEQAARVVGLPAAAVVALLAQAREGLQRALGEQAPTALRRVI